MKKWFILAFMAFCAQSMAFTTTTVECTYNNDIETVAFTTTKPKFEMVQNHVDKKVKVYVANIHKPAEADDYISFSKNGRTMTYPLNCKKM